VVLGNDYRKWLSIVSVNTILENSLQGSNTADEQMATVDGALIKQDWKLLVASLQVASLDVHPKPCALEGFWFLTVLVLHGLGIPSVQSSFLLNIFLTSSKSSALF